MKKRKGYGRIFINGQTFQFNWADNPSGPTLFLYDCDNRKIEIPYSTWLAYPDSEEYSNKEFRTWHGKRKKGAEWAGWGKRETREMYFKYLKLKNKDER